LRRRVERKGISVE